MIIQGQNKKDYNVFAFSLQGKTVSCRDYSDKRKKHIIGVYPDRKRAAEIFLEIMDCTEGCYKMPMQ